MDMSSSMSMAMSPSMTMSSVSSSPSAASGMGGMGGMSMGGDSCKIAMTWNWYTIGACFISKSWQVTSSGMFAGSCIGVICLVISLEFLRRVQREYEAFIRRQDQKKDRQRLLGQVNETQSPSESGESSRDKRGDTRVLDRFVSQATSLSAASRPDRATLIQRQVIRSLLHMVQFGVAYFIMLLAMYYNGYIIICIIIGAFLGSFFFSWDQLLDGYNKPQAADVTGCCG